MRIRGLNGYRGCCFLIITSQIGFYIGPLSTLIRDCEGLGFIGFTISIGCGLESNRPNPSLIW